MAKTRRKPGRPKTKGHKDPTRSIRVPDAEWEKWRRAAADKGVTIAALVRETMNRKLS